MKKKKTKVQDELLHIYKHLENEIKEILGTQVTINKKNDKMGKIEIEYYSENDLERIIELMNSIKH
jgi:ParB family chromosome partitioning protein